MCVVYVCSSSSVFRILLRVIDFVFRLLPIGRTISSAFSCAMAMSFVVVVVVSVVVDYDFFYEVVIQTETPAA